MRATAASCPRSPRGRTSRRSPDARAALAEAGVELGDIDAVAVTRGPGLAGALMVGVGAAKALALALEKPLYAVNHLVGHVGADLLEARRPLERPTSPCSSQAGTPRCARADLVYDVELLGETIDDAAARLRQGGAAARPALPRRPRDRARCRVGDPPTSGSQGGSPSRKTWGAPLRLLVLGAQDGGRASGRAVRGCRRAGTGGCRGQFPRGGRRRSGRESGRRL